MQQQGPHSGYGRGGRCRSPPLAHTFTTHTRRLGIINNARTSLHWARVKSRAGPGDLGACHVDGGPRSSERGAILRAGPWCGGAGGRGHGRNLRFSAISPCDAPSTAAAVEPQTRDINYCYAFSYALRIQQESYALRLANHVGCVVILPITF